MPFIAKLTRALLCFAGLAGLAWAQLPPDAAEQQRILRNVTEFARAYNAHVPDFTCTRTTQHFLREAEAAEWTQHVKASYELSYYGHQEHYRLRTVNDVPKKSLPASAKARGWVENYGDFGDILNDLFDPKTHPDFKWNGWDYLHGKRVYSFSYHVSLAESQAVSSLCHSLLIATTCKSVKFAFHGLLMVDPETQDIARITQVPEDLPPDHPQGLESVDYGRVAVADTEYLLPIADQFETTTGKSLFRNQSTYEHYHKFVVESGIKTSVSEVAGGTPVKPPLPASASEPEPLHAGNCFSVRDSTAHAKPPAVVRGFIDMAFNLTSQAEKELLALARSAEFATIAHSQLALLYQHTGQARQALDQLRLAGGDPGPLEILRAMANYPAMSVAARGRSSLRMVQDGEGLTLPITVNGHAASFGLDTGAAISTLTEGQAKSLGMDIQDDRFSLSDVNGRELKCHLAIAGDLQAGSLHLRNVPFCALMESPAGEHPGILGLPVILTFETIRWNRNGAFEIGVPAARPNVAQANLCFDGGTLALQAQISQHSVAFDFDTGNPQTFLYAEFKDDFADLAKSAGKKETYDVQGMGEAAELEATQLPEIQLSVGNFSAVFRDVLLLTTPMSTHGPGLYGNAGRDILDQATRVTVDFKAMKLTLER